MFQDVQELKRFPLFNGLTETELQALAQILESRQLQAGELIFAENDASHEIYFIRSGKVEIFTSAQGKVREHLLAVLSEGSEFGELAFLDESTRSASARAAAATELIVLHQAPLIQLPGSARILNRLASNIALSSAERLKRTNQNYVASLEKQIEAMKLQHEFGQFFIYTLACYAIGTIINTLLHSYLRDVDVYARTFSWSYLLVLLLPSLFIVWKLHMPLSEIGITTQRWRKSFLEGAIVSGLCLVLFAAYVGLGRWTPWISLPPMSSAALAWVPSYMVHSALQEFLARGIVQTSFQHFFDDTKGWRSVLLASILFSLFHVHFGLMAVVVTLLSSFLFGSFYLRHHNLIGVSLLHGTLGSLAFILGVL